MAKTSPFKLVQHRVQFFDGRPDEINDCTDKKYLERKGAEVIFGSAQQESITFEITSEIKGLVRVTWVYWASSISPWIYIKEKKEVLGSFSVGTYTKSFDKEESAGDGNQIAKAWQFKIEQVFQDESGNIISPKRVLEFKFV